MSKSLLEGDPKEHTELVEVYRAEPLTLSAPNTFSAKLPLKGVIRRAFLRINLGLTIGTGSGAATEGELAIVKRVDFRSDKGERFFHNCPGRFLYRQNQVKNGTAGVKDAIAAADGTYRVDFDLFFIDPKSERPMDTALVASRYRSLELSITMGALSDLLSTVGTAALTATFDLYFERYKGELPEDKQPILYQEVGMAVPVNPSNQQYVDMERAADLAYKSLYVHSANSATAGTGFSGTAASTVLTDVSVESSDDTPFDTILFDVLNRLNKKDYQFESAVAGLGIINFMTGKSLKEAIYSGQYSMLRTKWTNGSLSTSQVSLGYEAVRGLR